MQSLLSSHGVYSPEDVDGTLARVFGVGVRPLHLEEALFEAMPGRVAQPAVGALSEPKSIRANQRGVRAFVERVGCRPWEWRPSHADESFEDLLKGRVADGSVAAPVRTEGSIGGRPQDRSE